MTTLASGFSLSASFVFSTRHGKGFRSKEESKRMNDEFERNRVKRQGDITCQELKLCVYYVSVYFSRRCQLVTRIPILATGAAGS